MIELNENAKNALRDGGYSKRWQIDVYDGETKTLTIGNDNLVSESINIDERLCSSTDLEFGLCEGTSFKFVYFGLDDISNKRLKVTIHVEGTDGVEYPITLGWFNVDSCVTQKSTGQRKCVAYNKLRSEYLDQETDEVVKLIVAEGEQNLSNVSVAHVLEKLLEGFSIRLNESISVDTVISSSWGDKTSWDDYDKMNGSTVVQTGIASYHMSAEISPFGSNYNKDDYYRVGFNPKAIRSFLASYVDQNYTYKLEDQLVEHDPKTWLELMSSSNFSEKVQIKENAWGGGATLFTSDNFGTYGDGIQYTPWLVEVDTITLSLPILFEYVPPNISEFYRRQEIQQRGRERLELLLSQNVFFVERKNLSDLEKKRITSDEIAKWDGVTPRELQSAVYETECQFGVLDKETDLFSGIELNKSSLYPQTTLYPRDSLYPSGAVEATFKDMYSSLFTDNHGVKKWKKLIITYKGLNSSGEEEDKKLERTINSDGNINYNMSDNWLFRNLVWTSDEVGAYADRMVAKMQNMSWFPFDMDCAGLPYLETGDMIEIDTEDGAETSYILERQLKGLQNLQDSMACGSVETF